MNNLLVAMVIKGAKRTVIWLLLLLLLAGCSGGIYSGTLVFEGAHQFGADTRLPGDVFVRAGTAEFGQGSLVEGTIYQLGGTLSVDGVVTGDLVQLDGDLTLGPQAVVGGDLRAGGGTLQQAETAVVQGEVVRSGVEIPLERRRNPGGFDDFLRYLVGALLLAVAGALFARRWPRPVATAAAAVTNHWPVSVALGSLVLLVLPPLLVMMAFTIVLLPLVLLLLGIILLVVGFGCVTLGYTGGGMMINRWGWPRTVASGTFWGTLLLLLSFELPLVGIWVGAVAAVISSGAILLTRFGTRSFSPAQQREEPPDPASYARPEPGTRE